MARSLKLGVCTVQAPGCLKEFTITPGYTTDKDVCYVCLLKKKKGALKK
jgi:hypothetical protein